MQNKPLDPQTHWPAHGCGAAAETRRPRLPHESLDAWQVAREVVAFVAEHRSRFRGLPGELSSHIERSSVSVAMNIAEAAGRLSPKDRKSRFAIARGEACEVAAALEIAAVFGALEADPFARARSLLIRLTQMLSRLAA